MFRQFWLTFTLLPKRWLHAPVPAGATLAGRPPCPTLGPMLSGGVFAAPSAPWSWSPSPPPGTEFVEAPGPLSAACSSPETSRLWILLRWWRLNGAAPADGVPAVDPRPMARTPADSVATRTRRRLLHMGDHPRSRRLTGLSPTGVQRGFEPGRAAVADRDSPGMNAMMKVWHGRQVGRRVDHHTARIVATRHNW